MPSRAQDEFFLRRAIRLAMNGRGLVEPNPMVGCVIVKDARVIGQGWHERFGGPHAEPNALARCAESPQGATAYVTLEPCCHTNKKTPPCTPKLIEAKVARVVLGCTDPSPEVDGKGVQALRAAGIEVTTGVLEDECRQLIAPFIGRALHQRPYFTLKWAQTADGKVAAANGARLRISKEKSDRAVHELRARCDAIIVGINTVLTDDPLLTARGVDAPRTLRRYVLDRRLRIPPASRLVQTARQTPLVIGTDPASFSLPRARELEDLGAELLPVPSLERLGADLYRRQVTHALVEPGPTLARSMFEQAWADRLWVIRSPARIDDPAAPSAAPVPAHYLQVGQITLEGDCLTEYLNPSSPLFFAATPSADFILIRPPPAAGPTA